LEPLAALKQVTDVEVVGKTPAFLEAHVLKALELIGASSIGRGQLAKELRLGEGTIRTLVGRLKGLGLLSTSRGGMTLTESGREILSGLHELLMSADIPETTMTVDSRNHAVLVYGAAGVVRKGIEQRDQALMAGAKGATTLVREGGRLLMPGMEDPLDPDVIEYIEEAMNPANGDVVIIGSSDDAFLAEIGAKSAALKLLES
jgi:DNA-binding MarR family transcriptional regulator